MHKRARLILVLSALALLGLLVTPEVARADPPTPLNPLTSGGESIRNLFNLVLIPALVVFFGVEGAILYVVLRYRRRPGTVAEPAQIHGHTRLEVAWTLAPAAVLAMLFFWTVQTLESVQAVPPDALRVEVIGHQWWWEFRYPDLEITTAGELVVPVGKPVRFDITSADVIHSFWVPELAGKVDAIPGQVNVTWVEINEPGEYAGGRGRDEHLHGQCAEFCGMAHAYMLLRVKALPPAEFEAWVERQQAPAPEELTGLAAQGRDLFVNGFCQACHTIRGTSAQGSIGPDLSHFASRDLLASFLDNTPENLRAWIADPPAVKPGTKMPKYLLSPEEIDALVTFLKAME
ncbi:MAG: cytochrome c oxidase subunit II [Chloroflexi bacterium]|nr:cytochrome c oxidase subunit II [Chloroflexota bacterium]